MTKQEAIEKIEEMRLDVKSWGRFKGQAKFVNACKDLISWLERFKVNGNIPLLYYRERRAEYNFLKDSME